MDQASLCFPSTVWNAESLVSQVADCPSWVSTFRHHLLDLVDLPVCAEYRRSWISALLFFLSFSFFRKPAQNRQSMGGAIYWLPWHQQTLPLRLPIWAMGYILSWVKSLQWKLVSFALTVSEITLHFLNVTLLFCRSIRLISNTQSSRPSNIIFISHS